MAGGLKTAKRAGGKGTGMRTRSLIVLVLLSFFVVATGVIARRTFGISQAKEIRRRLTQRDAIENSRVKLEVEIRDASSRARLGPIVERRLHMYVPADSQVIILPRQPPQPRSKE